MPKGRKKRHSYPIEKPLKGLRKRSPQICMAGCLEQNSYIESAEISKLYLKRNFEKFASEYVTQRYN